MWPHELTQCVYLITRTGRHQGPLPPNGGLHRTPPASQTLSRCVTISYRAVPVRRRSVGWLRMFGRKKQSTHERTGRNLFRCSFCNNSQEEVRRLIAGPNVYICDECVDICFNIVNRETEPSSTAPAADVPVTCSLCGLVTLPGAALILPGRGPLCAACATAVAEAVGKNEQSPN